MFRNASLSDLKKPIQIRVSKRYYLVSSELVPIVPVVCFILSGNLPSYSSYQLATVKITVLKKAQQMVNPWLQLAIIEIASVMGGFGYLLIIDQKAGLSGKISIDFVTYWNNRSEHADVIEILVEKEVLDVGSQ